MSSCKNPYRSIETEVIEATTETPTIRTLRLKPKEVIPFKAGQFVELMIPGVGEAPFTPSSNPSTPEIIQLTIMKVGKVTEVVHQIEKGDIVGLRGPMGKGYPIDDFKGQEILVVGGGCGFAPLRSLMYSFFDRSSDFKNLYFRGGCKAYNELVYREEMEEWAKRDD